LYSFWLLRVRLFRVAEVVIWAWGFLPAGAVMVTATAAAGMSSSGASRFTVLSRLSAGVFLILCLAQARALADYSVKKGHKKFAVLFPQTNYGVELVKYFEMAVKERGGSVVRQAAYSPGTADFSAEVKRVFGVKVTEKMDGRRKVREFTPTVNVDALFLPDSFESAALIVPYLDYYNIKDIQLLGANGWNSPRLPELAGKAVEGAVFVDGFFAASNRPGTEDFTRSFMEAYGKEPGVISAQAYDAARMLMIAARDQAVDRESVAGRLRGLKDFRGATGSISFNARREAEKGLFLLTVEGGRIVEAAPVK